MAAIEVVGLARSFRGSGSKRSDRGRIEGVREVTFDVERGALFGILGPRGAGKTTRIKMLITHLLPTTGHARVLGFDVVADPREIRKRIGYVFGGDRGLYERLSGIDNLRYFAELYAIDSRLQKIRSQNFWIPSAW